MGSPAIFKGSNVKLLKDVIEFFTARTSSNVKIITNSTTNPTSVAVDANAGSLLADQSGNLYLKQDDGSTTNWKAIIRDGDISGTISDLDMFYSEPFGDTLAADFSTGNNATFLGGGSLAGTLADETGSPIAGTHSLKYTQAAGSLNDYVASPTISLDPKQAGNYVGFKLTFTYDGDANDIKFVLWDNTNSQDLTDSLHLFTSESNPTTYQAIAFVPAGVASLRWGFQVKVANTGAILIIDDVNGKTNPFTYTNIQKENVFSAYISNNGTAAVVSENTSFISSVTRTAAGRVRIVFNTDHFSQPPHVVSLATGNPSTENNTVMHDTSATYSAAELTIGTKDGGTDSDENFHVVLQRAEGDYLNIEQHVVTPAKSSLSDWIAYTPTVTSGFGTVTNVVGKYKQLGNNMLVKVTGTSGTTSAATVAVSLPKTIDTTFMNYNTTVGSHGEIVGHWGGDNGQSAGFVLAFTGTSQTSVYLGNIFSGGSSIVTAGNGNAIMASSQEFSVTISVPVEEFSNNATFLAAIPVMQIAILKDVKASATAGGTFTSGSWQTRDLNTVEGDSSIVTLSSNQFTLQAGKYLIRAKAPAYRVDTHQVKIYNATDASDVTFGQTALTNQTDDSVSHSFVESVIEITSPKTFELQHRCVATRATSGLGISQSFGNENVYAHVEITKIK